MTANAPATPYGSFRERILDRLDMLGDEIRSPVLGRRVPGTIPVAVVAGLVSLAASAYFVPSRLSMAYGDALSHLTIARRLFDTLSNPGLGQLGTVWLPIPHLLLAPFVVSLWAWQTGWGAALLGAACLAATVAGTFRAAARWGLLGFGRITVVAALVLNPAMLYLYSTALTEPVLIAGMAGSYAGLANWATKKRRLSPGELAVFAGIPAAMAAMSRYEGWALVAAAAVYVMVVSWNRDHDPKSVLKYVLGFTAVPMATIAWWFGFNWVTFGDPLAFIFGPYSANALQAELVSSGQSTKGSLALSLDTLNVAVASSVGVGLLLVAGCGVVVMLLVNRSNRLPGFLFTTAATYIFMAVSLYFGQAVILNSASSSTTVWNNRYGMSSILAVALIAGSGVHYATVALTRLRPSLATAGQVLVAVLAAGALVGQSYWIGQAPFERSLVLYEARSQLSQSGDSRAAAAWLGAHYDGGRILLDEGVPANSILPLAGIPLNQYYLRATDTFFEQALGDPVRHARWLWVSTGDAAAGDRVSQMVTAMPDFADHYQLAHSSIGTQIFRRVVD